MELEAIIDIPILCVCVCVCVSSEGGSLLRKCQNFQQCGILTSVDSDLPVQPPIKLRHTK